MKIRKIVDWKKSTKSEIVRVSRVEPEEKRPQKLTQYSVLSMKIFVT